MSMLFGLWRRSGTRTPCKKIAALGEVYNQLQQRIDQMQSDYDSKFEAWMEDAESQA
jgi:hypothetical protein